MSTVTESFDSEFTVTPYTIKLFNVRFNTEGLVRVQAYYSSNISFTPYIKKAYFGSFKMYKEVKKSFTSYITDQEVVEQTFHSSYAYTNWNWDSNFTVE